MKNIQIITDSSADLSKELVEKYGIDVVPFYVSFSEETYLKEGYQTSTSTILFKIFVNCTNSSASQFFFA